MADSMEEELNSLWLEVEKLTSIRFIKRKILPKVSNQFSDEANESPIITSLFLFEITDPSISDFNK